MAELKTKPTSNSVEEYLRTVIPADKQQDSFTLLKMLGHITKEKPVMWGTSLIGFGSYHYKSERSKQQGDWPLIGFSPRKQNLTIYIMCGFKDLSGLLTKLGKYKTSVGCLYIKRLTDVDQKVLTELLETAFDYMQKTHK